MRNQPTTRAEPRAFTLLEMLVVVAVILLLIALLVPALAYAKRLAYISRTTAELKTIGDACDAYCANLGFYPGVFSDAVISASHISPTAAAPSLTGTQNLVLSLMGSINPSTTAGTTQITVDTNIAYVIPPSFTAPANSSAFPATGSATGPNDLANNKSYPSFYAPRAGDITTIVGGMPSTSYSSGGSALATLPTLVDQFPDAMPILYYRKTPGVDTPAVAESWSSANLACYYRNCNSEYTDSATLTSPDNVVLNQISGNNIAPLSKAGTDSLGTLAAMAGGCGLWGSGGNYSSGQRVGTSNGTAGFGNLYESKTPSNTSAPPGGSWASVPAPSGAYMLISAGPNRLYGDSSNIVVVGGQ